jgi:phage terminase large subunit GpA-like protein
MNKQQYAEYLQSRHWKSFKASVYRKVHNCAACGSREKLNIHHLTYENIHKETIADVVVLCATCHTALHNSEKLGFSRERWINLHCKKIAKFQRELKSRKKAHKAKTKADFLERARRRALSYYTKQNQREAIRQISKYAPKPVKPKHKRQQKPSSTTLWKEAHRDNFGG